MLSPMPAKKKSRAARAQTVFPSESYTARQKRGRPTLGFSLPQDVVDALRSHAETTGQTMSAIVAEAVRAYLASSR